MNRSEFLLKLKAILNTEDGCITKTTLEKNEGYVPYNRHDIKWGQVDGNGKKYVRVVFDLLPGYLKESEFSRKTELSITLPRKIKTGYRFNKKYKVDGHDQLILFLEDSYLESERDGVQAILEYAKEFVAASSFKVQASR